jgi:hypothetical protein
VTLTFTEPERVFVVAGQDYAWGSGDEQLGYQGAIVTPVDGGASAITIPVASKYCDKCVKVWAYDLELGTLLHESTTCFDPGDCIALDAGAGEDAGAEDASHDTGAAGPDAAPSDAGDAASGDTASGEERVAGGGCQLAPRTSDATIPTAFTVLLLLLRRRRR